MRLVFAGMLKIERALAGRKLPELITCGEIDAQILSDRGVD
jgi:hypothetical protein